jgi:hypothetical protein
MLALKVRGEQRESHSGRDMDATTATTVTDLSLSRMASNGKHAVALGMGN